MRVLVICKRLRSAGIGSVRALHDADRSRAIVAWGSIEGERVRLGLRGEDVPTPARVRRSVAHGRVLGRSGCWRGSRQVVRWLAVCALRRCVEGGQVPRRVAVEVVTRSGEVRTGTASIASYGHERPLLRAVSGLWDAAADADRTMGRPAWVSCSMLWWMRVRPSSLTSIRASAVCRGCSMRCAITTRRRRWCGGNEPQSAGVGRWRRRR